MTAGHTLGAIRSVRMFYPNIPIYIVDDEFKSEDVQTWRDLYNFTELRPDFIFDPDSTKLLGLPNTAYIRKPHFGYETEGHGIAITYAMQFIHTKWVIHLSSDTRMIKRGFVEMLESFGGEVAAVGQRVLAKENYINLGKWMMAFRGDLYHKHFLNFMPDKDVPVDAGTPMCTQLDALGYDVKDIDMTYYSNHIRFTGDEIKWNEEYLWL